MSVTAPGALSPLVLRPTLAAVSTCLNGRQMMACHSGSAAAVTIMGPKELAHSSAGEMLQRMDSKPRKGASYCRPENSQKWPAGVQGGGSGAAGAQPVA